MSAQLPVSILGTQVVGFGGLFHGTDMEPKDKSSVGSVQSSKSYPMRSTGTSDPAELGSCHFKEDGTFLTSLKHAHIAAPVPEQTENPIRILQCTWIL